MSDNIDLNKNQENNNTFSTNNSSTFDQQRPNSVQNPFQADNLQSSNLYSAPKNMNTSDSKGLIMDIPVNVQIVLGSTTMPVATLMNLKRGSVISLDATLGDPVDIVVNGKIIAKGELVPVENDPSRFGVSLISILNKR